MHSPTNDAPVIDPGELVHLIQPERRSSAIHQLVARLLPHVDDGDVRWIDALDHASPATLASFVHEHRLRSVQVARGFTAHQHHAIVRALQESNNDGQSLLVAPSCASLYGDDDVPAYEAEAFFADTVATLRDVATSADVPVLVSTAPDSPSELTTVLDDTSDRTIHAEQTSMGYRFEGPEWETTIYWSDGFWQTTIPYWVDLLGSVGERGVESLADEGAALPMGV